MFDSRTASECVLRACVVVVVAARAKSVVPRRRIVGVVRKFWFRKYFSKRSLFAVLWLISEQILLLISCGDLALVVAEDNCYRA